MSLRRVLLVASFLLLISSTAKAQTYVKDTGFTNATCATWTFSFTPTNANDFWVVVVGLEGSTSNPTWSSISDNNGGTWSSVDQMGGGGTAGAGGIAFTTAAHASGATTVTITEVSGSATCGQTADVYEFSKVTALALDQSALSNTAGSGSTWSTATTGVLSKSPEIAVAVFTSFQNGSTVASASNPTNGFIQASAGVLQASNKEGAGASSFLIPGSTSALSTQLTASASVATSDSLLVTLSGSFTGGKSWVSGD